jgi:glycosyltransferase involved in cell wall biosynthesis
MKLTIKNISFRVRLQFAIMVTKLISRKNVKQQGQFDFDIVFIIPPRGANGWILEAICREISYRALTAKVVFINSGEELPLAESYFFSHYVYYFNALLKLQVRDPSNCYVFATHLEPEKHQISNDILRDTLNTVRKVFCMNSELIKDLTSMGVSPSTLLLTVGAADSGLFSFHERSQTGKVGFCSAFYARKSPDLVLNIAKKLSDKEVLLIGRGWKNFQHYDTLLSLSNFEYVETEYINYPKLYSQMTVFVSVSELEGGPIPLLEAMMSNVVPVAGNTGFAPDVISYNENGYIYDISSSSSEDIVNLIRKSYDLKTNIRETVLQYDWNIYSKNVLHVMLPLQF